MVKLISLISGSSGNASVVSDGTTTLLIDCGMSGSRLKAALGSAGLSVDDINGVLITHEHNDHVRGIGVIARRHKYNIYGTEKTLLAMECGDIADEQLHPITPYSDFEINTIGIRPFSISHDAVDPVGYSFFAGNEKVSVATDTGIVTDSIENAVMGSSQIILESNHDVEMLRVGSYPYYLKQRILSSKGHLSNETSAQFAARLAAAGAHYIMLAHLSEENNHPDIAYMTARNALEESGAVLGQDVSLNVANRYTPTVFGSEI